MDEWKTKLMNELKTWGQVILGLLIFVGVILLIVWLSSDSPSTDFECNPRNWNCP